MFSKLMVILFCATAMYGAEYTATSCSSAHVQDAITAASDGDIVRIPAGECTWTSVMTFCKSIELLGAGQAATIITANIGTAWNDAVIRIDNCNSKTYRISGFTITASTTTVGSYGLILLWSGSGSTFRIDNMTLNGGGRRGVSVVGQNYGVVHTSTFSEAGAIISSGASPNVSWEAAMSLGGSDAVIFEDIVATAATTNPEFDCIDGGRVVYRHSTFTGVGVFTHGYDSVPRGCMQMEAYSNTIDSSSRITRAIQFRGGTGVVYNNVINGSYFGPTFQVTNYRSSSGGFFPDRDMCDGNAAEDGNTAPAETNRGWPCLDQIGRGTNQGSYPLYEWNNCITSLGCLSDDANDINITVMDGSGTDYTATHIQAGRDFVKNTEMPGYTALAYPHPLRGAAPKLGITGAARVSGKVGTP